MPFDTSAIRSVHSFRLTFIGQIGLSRITRAQLIFLAYLIDNGHVRGFTVRSVTTVGLSWELANQYLKYLRRVGYANKTGRQWTLTEAALEFYHKFMKDFYRRQLGPFSWK